ncbi:cysteine synthase A [Pedobacter cryoconitis]|uniref:N-(2-amino-2-carboxyethyl)-L-glutamate synthase n=1 Tax=Pedobacter cryoconitis TaxID=188932 RepID=A0A7W8YVC3_9SPHI|nr:2,3-diaminopropionate biosynthesis protein SbnA [Pedobacter cryoconitis]MBB5622475.1 cysteine synthase A [Pedobacter cryoconitis]MBB5647629.1 cysteine synthase A [Pedobacter cryoconitis]
MIIPNILEQVGQTPLISVKLDEFSNINLYAKLETYNPTGSVKDRAASYILKDLLRKGIIDQDTTIIESTSGNFGVSLSAYCKYLNLKFIAVVDPHISKINEMLIRANNAEIIKVTEPDNYGGYLISRIEKIKELQNTLKKSYWINQYQNPLNAKAYYHSLGKEICYQIEQIDYVFLGISSGGTITGVSQKLKENFPNVKIIAVDMEGSRIFTGRSKKRYIPGIGSSIVPEILKEAYIDDFVLVNEEATINACHELLEKHNVFVGGSSGSCLAAIKKYFLHREINREINVVCVFPDRGERYFDTIYNKEWSEAIIKLQQQETLLEAVPAI